MTDNGAVDEAVLSRRDFFHCSTCAATALAVTGVASSGAAAAVVEAVGSSTAGEKLHEFGYGKVRLTGGPIKDQYDRIHAHYLALDNDRLLKVFRQHARLPAPGPDMGGWYDADGFVPGLTFGQYISGLARLGAATGDQACHDKVRALVAGFGEVLAQTDNPYPGKNSEKVWPAYVMDKYVVGLIDAYQLSGVEQAKALLPVVIDKCLPFISPVSLDRIGKKDPPYDETFVLPENLFVVAEITGDRKYHDLAVHYLLDRKWFDPLAGGQDVLPDKHAYSHTIALSSGGKAFLATGKAKYRAALVNAWRFMEPQRFASGGWGPEEQFVPLGQGKLHASLASSTAHFETPCGSYADLKLARYLIRLTGDPRYADGLERTLYNTLLATRMPDSDGNYPYYSNYGAAADKEYYQKKWPCCSGTLVQGVADYVLNIYFHDDEALVVNLYTPSEVTWDRPGGSVIVAQDTDYPATGASRIRIVKTSGQTYSLKLRIPAWTAGATVRVNGKPVTATPGSYATITRRWAAGDVVSVDIPQPLRTLAIDPQNPATVAVLRGPVMYVGLNPWAGLPTIAVDLPGALRPVPGQQQAYVVKVANHDLVFVPFHTVREERYDTYFRKA